MPIGEIIGLGVSVVSNLLQKPEPTPEEQKAKAGVWYSMLQDWLLNTQDSYSFANKWVNQLPFSQNKTKSRFMDNNIRGKSSAMIIDNLVGKINDELVKGRFPSLSKDVIISGITGGGSPVGTQSGLIAGNTSVNMDLTGGATNRDINESRGFFLIMAGVTSVALLLLVIFKKK